MGAATQVGLGRHVLKQTRCEARGAHDASHIDPPRGRQRELQRHLTRIDGSGKPFTLSLGKTASTRWRCHDSAGSRPNSWAKRSSPVKVWVLGSKLHVPSCAASTARASHARVRSVSMRSWLLSMASSSMMSRRGVASVIAGWFIRCPRVNRGADFAYPVTGGAVPSALAVGGEEPPPPGAVRQVGKPQVSSLRYRVRRSMPSMSAARLRLSCTSWSTRST